MAKQPNLSNPTAGRAFAGRWWVVPAAAAALATACTLEIRNVQPAQTLARQAQPPGSVYVGWRVYQDRCARCHGAAAGGGADAPDLLPRLRTMGPQRFVDLVLRRYEWGLAIPADAGPGRESLIRDIVQRRAGALTMPAWQGEPSVNAHIVDLYAYLSARAEGTQGPDRPVP